MATACHGAEEARGIGISPGLNLRRRDPGGKVRPRGDGGDEPSGDGRLSPRRRGSPATMPPGRRCPPARGTPRSGGPRRPRRWRRARTRSTWLRRGTGPSAAPGHSLVAPFPVLLASLAVAGGHAVVAVLRVAPHPAAAVAAVVLPPPGPAVPSHVVQWTLRCLLRQYG